MKRFRKALALVLGATMMFASTMTVMAADPTTTAGAGQILDYKTVTQVVPTSMKVAINPNGYKVNLRYHKVADDATFDADKKYYSKAGDVYSVDTTITSENWSTKKATAYIADEVTNQIITFNYGLANKSTVARNITVDLAVTADSSVKFVDTAAKATAEAAADDGGAKKGDYKIFLQLVPTKVGTTPTTNTYEKATAYAAQTQYYTRNASGVYAEATIADEAAFKASSDTLYIETTTIGTEIQASELGDITMQDSTAPIDFAAGDGSTSATVAYSLPKATYTLKDDEYLEIGKTYDNLADKFEMTALGGVAGFTIKGNMNTNTEWSQLETKTITITPTYRFEDATGLETAVATGLNQIEAVAAPIFVAGDTAGTIVYTTAKVSEVTSIKLTNESGEFDAMVDFGSYYSAATSAADETSGKTTITFDSNFNAFFSGTVTANITYKDASGATQTTTVSMNMGD